MMLLIIFLVIVQALEVAATSINNPLLQGNLSDYNSKDRLLRVMTGRSVVGKWNAIIAIKGESLNQIWKKQYDEEIKYGFIESIASERAISFETQSTKLESRVTVVCGPTLVQLMPNRQDKASVKIKIKSAKVEYWETMKRSGKVDNYDSSVPLRDDTAVSFIIYLPRISGALTKDSKVVLDLSNGALQDVTLNLDHRVNAVVKNEIKLLFHRRISRLGEYWRITYDRKVVPSGLVPDKFYLKMGGMGKENPFGTLFVFFRTHSSGATAQAQTPRDFRDPLSIGRQIIPTGYELAMFINRKSLPKNVADSLFHLLKAMSILPVGINNPKLGLSGFKVDSVSAITQVLYPNKNVFHFTEVYFPDDLVLLGKVNQKSI